MRDSNPWMKHYHRDFLRGFYEGFDINQMWVDEHLLTPDEMREAAGWTERPRGSGLIWSPTDRGYEPREGYIDAGIVLSETVMITDKIYEDATAEEWNAWKRWVDEMANLRANEILTDKLYHIFDIVPTITSMEAS